MYPIDFFWRAAARRPSNIAIDAPEGLIRYDTLAAQVAALAAAFSALDPAPQSRVGICAGNSAAHIAAPGLSRIGAGFSFRIPATFSSGISTSSPSRP